jgi:hypothetical protein
MSKIKLYKLTDAKGQPATDVFFEFREDAIIDRQVMADNDVHNITLTRETFEASDVYYLGEHPDRGAIWTLTDEAKKRLTPAG